jgi:hypothetical protein
MGAGEKFEPQVLSDVHLPSVSQNPENCRSWHMRLGSHWKAYQGDLCALWEAQSSSLLPPLPLFFRLLAQLNETEAAFDEFWAKHQQKLEQCLQLRHFEQGFREVSG